MADLEKGAIFGIEAEKIINSKLIAVEKKLRTASRMTYEKLVDLALEANSLILMVTGDDFEAYEMWKYRVFVNPDGRYFLIQGMEVDTDYVPNDYRELNED